MPSIKERALRLERALTSTPDSKNEDSWMKNTSESTERHRTVTQKSYLNKFKHRRVPAINKSASRSNESTKESSNPLQQRMENSSDKDMVNTDRQGDVLDETESTIIVSSNCPLCSDLKPFFDSKSWGLKDWMMIIKHRSSLGCPTCPAVEEASAHLLKLCIARGASNSISCHLSSFQDTGVAELYMHAKYQNQSEYGIAMRLYICEGQPTPYLELPSFQIEENSQSWRLSKARKWMDNCLTTHEGCKKDISGLPHRVLDLREFSTVGKIKLVETEGMKDMYACLSYCWGTDNNFVTTPNNLPVFMTGIPWPDLPQTYKDAVIVASKLGIQFLWIDALCIMQGNKEDPESLKEWEEQSSLMSSIYGNATLTIAATNSRNTHEGFLDKCKLVEPPLSFSCSPKENGLPFSLYGRIPYDHTWLQTEPPEIDHSRSDSWSSNFLRERAWCYQEYFLAPRVLSFGYEEIAFDCNGGGVCECGQYPSEYDKRRENMKARDARRISSIGISDSLSSVWTTLVTEYSHRRITFPETRLTVLSGIAQMFQQKTGTDYLAGHWFDRDFIASLTWYHIFSRPRRRAKPYRAPSWSWASVEFSLPISWNLYLQHPGYTTWHMLPETRVMAQSSAAVAGYIIMQGILLNADLVWKNGDPCITRNGVSVTNHEPTPYMFCSIFLDVQLPHRKKPLVCWYVGVIRRMTNKGQHAMSHEIMLLEKIVNNIYRRIGWLRLGSTSDTVLESYGLTWNNDWNDHLKFIEGYESCLKGFAIV